MTDAAAATQDRLPEHWMAVFLIGGLTACYAVLQLAYRPFDPDTCFVFGRDFINFWLGGRVAAEHNFALLIDLPAYNARVAQIFGTRPEDVYVFSYPPHMLLFLLPFGALPYKAAFLLWSCINIGCVARAVRLLGGNWALAGLACLSPAMVVVVAHGQFAGILALLATCALLRADDRPLLAGTCLALMSVKPHLALSLGLFLLLTGHLRVLTYAAIGTAGLIGASLLAFGLEPWTGFLDWTIPFHQRAMAEFVFDLFTTATSIYIAGRTAGLSAGAAQGLQLVYSLVLIAAAVVLTWRRGRTPATMTLGLAAVVFSVPYFQPYDVAIIVPALVVALWRPAAEAERPLLPPLVALVLWIAPSLALPFGFLKIPVPAALLAGTLLLALFRELRREHAVRSLATVPAGIADWVRARVAKIGVARPDGRVLLYALASLALSGLIIAWIYRPESNGLDVTGHAIGRDFINVWAGTRLAFSGAMATLFDNDAYTAAIGTLFGALLPFHAWSYPASALPLFWPFAQFPYFVGLALWTVLLFGAFAAVALAPVAREMRGAALVLLVLAPASLINAVGGQNGFLTAALFLGGILWLDRAPVLAGVLIGLLTIKPQLGLVLPFALVALRAWKTIAAATVTAALLLGLSVALFGMEPWQRYFDTTAPFHVFTLQRFYGFYTTMMASVLTGARTFGLGYGPALVLQVAVAIPVLALAVWTVRRTTDPCRRAFVLASAAPLLTPYVFNYDLTAIAVVLVWLVVGRLPWRPDARALYLIAWLAPTGMMALNMLGVGIAPLVFLALFGLAVREGAGAPAAAPAGSAPALA